MPSVVLGVRELEPVSGCSTLKVAEVLPDEVCSSGDGGKGRGQTSLIWLVHDSKPRFEQGFAECLGVYQADSREQNAQSTHKWKFHWGQRKKGPECQPVGDKEP